LAVESDLACVVGDLSRAFAHYPLCDWLFRDNPKRQTACDRLFEVLIRRVGFRSGSIYRPAAGGAAAVWIQSEALARISLPDNLRILTELLPVCYSLRILRLVALHQANTHHNPQYRPYDYLYFLGVDPRHQGRGIGTGLMHDGLGRSDSLGRHVFLETSDEANLRFYERFGFEIYDYYDLGKGSPPTWTLLRPPLQPRNHPIR